MKKIIKPLSLLMSTFLLFGCSFGKTVDPNESNKPQEQQKEDEQKPEEQKPEEQKPEEQKPEEQKPEEQKPEEQKPEEQKPEEEKPEEQKPEEEKPEEEKPEEQKPQEHVNHSDLDHDHLCDDCFEKLSDHEDLDKDHFCDCCFEKLSDHEDLDKDHICDYCEQQTSKHLDVDNDHICDFCNSKISEHIDEDHDSLCDICGISLHVHVDSNNDHACDTCFAVCSEHVRKEGECICDICGEALEHVDSNSDGICDNCSTKMFNLETIILDYDLIAPNDLSGLIGYSVIQGIISLESYEVSFTNVCLNELNSKSTPTWATPNDEPLKVIQFKNPRTAAGVIELKQTKFKEIKIEFYSDYNPDNDFAVTLNDVNIPMVSCDAEETSIATMSTATGRTFPVKLYTMTFEIGPNNIGNIKIQNQGVGARYVKAISCIADK